MLFAKLISKTILLLLLGFFLIACQADLKVKQPFTNTLVQCKSPRPEICTEQYLPVCASKDTGIRCVTTPCPSEENVTYGNACSACSDPKVHGYIPGGECK